MPQLTVDRDLFGLDARREARESVKHHGRFQGERPMTVILYDASLDGWGDSFWSDDNGEWCESIGRYVIGGDDSGFIWSYRYPTREDAMRVIDSLYDLMDEEE